MPPLPPLAIDEYDFASLRQAGQVYVDKTAYIQRMLEEPIKYAFLARPRRFGKSLLVSTLTHLFGRTDDALFRDLAIAAYLPQVPQVPVILLDMSCGVGQTSAQVHEALMDIVRDQAQRFGFVLRETPDTAPWTALSRLCSHLERTYGKFVVLVDEYDAALTELLVPSGVDASDSYAIQAGLRHFYRTLKTWNHAIQFVFITGILDIGGSGLFSALNNLQNLSDDARFNALCGFTEAEVDTFLRPHVEAAARNFGCAPEAMRERLRMHYNGYRFTVSGESLYNPISYLTVLKRLAAPLNAQEIVLTGFPRPWVRTGQTNFLFRYIQARGETLTDMDFSAAGAKDALDLDKPTLNALLFQSGFVTLKRVNGETILDFPNWEVETAFQEGLFFNCFGQQVGGQDSRARKLMRQMAQALEKGECASALDAFDRLLDGMSYAELAAESNFQIALHIVCSMVCSILRVDSEVLTRRGRADMAVKTRDTFYVFELKLDKSVAAAMQQIETRGYLDRYADEGKRVVGIGVNFVKRSNGDNKWEPSKANYAWDSCPGQATRLREQERLARATDERTVG